MRRCRSADRRHQRAPDLGEFAGISFGLKRNSELFGSSTGSEREAGADGSGGNRAPDEVNRRRNRNDQQENVRRDDRNSPPVNLPQPQQRSDPRDTSVNSRMGPAPSFDPKSLSINSPPSQERPSTPSQRFDPDNLPKNDWGSRSDPTDLPAHSPNPNLR
jgi:hypothetical protein